jgi:hypothetical protein
MLNLDSATGTLTGLVVAVRDDQLTAPTPCDRLIGLTGRDPGWRAPTESA